MCRRSVHALHFQVGFVWLFFFIISCLIYHSTLFSCLNIVFCKSLSLFLCFCYYITSFPSFFWISLSICCINHLLKLSCLFRRNLITRRLIFQLSPVIRLIIPLACDQFSSRQRDHKSPDLLKSIDTSSRPLTIKHKSGIHRLCCQLPQKNAGQLLLSFYEKIHTADIFSSDFFINMQLHASLILSALHFCKPAVRFFASIFILKKIHNKSLIIGHTSSRHSFFYLMRIGAGLWQFFTS